MAGGTKRFSAKRKLAAVQRLMRGESLEAVSRDLNVPVHRLSEWRDKVLLAAERHFATIEEFRQALAAFAAEYNASWLRRRHGYKTPNQIGAEQKVHETETATGFILAA